ncbi:MAG: hypothetical protein J7L07_11635, partial [Candidatus Odinarchaeota archaeon]|nr:hypothetical protein [Candidatus Odinarchaeota archaeon]
MRILRFTGVGIVRGSKKKPEVIAAIAPSLILDILKEYIKNTQSTSLMPFLLYVNTEYIKIFQGNNLGRPVKIALKKLYDLGYVRYEKVSDSSIPIDIFENGKPVDQVILLEKYKYDK